MTALRIVFFGLLILALLGVGGVTLLVYMSRHGDAHGGLVEGRLQPCGVVPNCVCSEDWAAANYPPVLLEGRALEWAWSDFKAAVVAAGGEVKEDSDGYLWATFATPRLGFVDDFEARLDPGGEGQVPSIRLRSASRVGYSDFGTNRKRADAVVGRFMAESGTRRGKGSP